MDKKVTVAMSGGVDSSAAALILQQQGYEINGITMRHFGADISEFSNDSDISEAKAVCISLGIPFEVADLSDEFKREVINNFCDCYLSGVTPNPCVVCNKKIKFGSLLNYVVSKGVDYLATGHYAITENQNGRVLLKKGLNNAKDQSYVLWSLTQNQLSRVIFPIGNMSKDDVRAIAEKSGFIKSDKPDSQDICFIKDGDYRAFLNRYLKKEFPSGNFLYKEGNILGRHSGAVGYTIGQRKGLGISYSEPLYVINKDMIENTVTLGVSEDLFAKRLYASQTNFIPFDKLDAPLKCKAKIRYKAKEADAIISPDDNNRVIVEFVENQRAISPGQSVVFYDGEYVLGGGIIE